MRLGKKGDANWVVVGLITFLIVLIVLVAFDVSFASFLNIIQGKTTCQTWVDVQSSVLGKQAGVKVVKYESPCKTYVEEIKVENERELYIEMADKMLTCMDSYRFGKRNFYSDIDFDFSKQYCRACNEVYLDPDSKVNFFDWESFQIFLNTEKPKYEKRTYAEIFTDAKDTDINFGDDVGKMKIDFTQPFYVFFTVNNEPYLSERLSTGAKFGVAAAYLTFKTVKNPKFVLGATAVATITGTYAAAGFKPGISLMTGEQAVEEGCDLKSIYINPVNNDDLNSKLANIKKQNEEEK